MSRLQNNDGERLNDFVDNKNNFYWIGLTCDDINTEENLVISCDNTEIKKEDMFTVSFGNNNNNNNPNNRVVRKKNNEFERIVRAVCWSIDSNENGDILLYSRNEPMVNETRNDHFGYRKGEKFELFREKNIILVTVTKAVYMGQKNDCILYVSGLSKEFCIDVLSQNIK